MLCYTKVIRATKYTSVLTSPIRHMKRATYCTEQRMGCKTQWSYDSTVFVFDGRNTWDVQYTAHSNKVFFFPVTFQFREYCACNKTKCCACHGIKKNIQSESEVRMPKKAALFRARTGTKCSKFWTICETNSATLYKISRTHPSPIIHWSPAVATFFQSSQRLIRENCSNLLVQFNAGSPTGPLPIGCQCNIPRAQRSYGRPMM